MAASRRLFVDRVREDDSGVASEEPSYTEKELEDPRFTEEQLPGTFLDYLDNLEVPKNPSKVFHCFKCGFEMVAQEGLAMCEDEDCFYQFTKREIEQVSLIAKWGAGQCKSIICSHCETENVRETEGVHILDNGSVKVYSQGRAGDDGFCSHCGKALTGI